MSRSFRTRWRGWSHNTAGSWQPRDKLGTGRQGLLGTRDPPSIKLRRGKLGRLLKNPGNGPKRHTGRDEVEIRYPVNYCFFWILRRRRTSRLPE
jgi:hypothetical protein